jgi:hypothetical protein
VTRRRRLILPLSVAPTAPLHEPDLAPEYKEAVLAALRWAWSELQSDHPNLVRSGDEESVTEKLQFILNDRSGGTRRASWLRDFETVSRNENQRTADGRIQKRPDMTFRPPPNAKVINATRWGWFVECKIIDGGASVTAYRDEGVRRFSDGEYAAWMESAAMLGYVRDGSRPAATLQTALTGRVGTRCHRPGASEDLSESEHTRGLLPNPCVDVTLTHLWLVA